VSLPLKLESAKVLSAAIERLLKALRAARRATCDNSTPWANQHMRGELCVPARRLDKQNVTAPRQEAATLRPDAVSLKTVPRRLHRSLRTSSSRQASTPPAALGDTHV
jgi:hypothetical protein